MWESVGGGVEKGCWDVGEVNGDVREMYREMCWGVGEVRGDGDVGKCWGRLGKCVGVWGR